VRQRCGDTGVLFAHLNECYSHTALFDELTIVVSAMIYVQRASISSDGQSVSRSNCVIRRARHGHWVNEAIDGYNGQHVRADDDAAADADGTSASRHRRIHDTQVAGHEQRNHVIVIVAGRRRQRHQRYKVGGHGHLSLLSLSAICKKTAQFIQTL